MNTVADDIAHICISTGTPGEGQEAVLLCTHGSFLIRRQRGHPGVALPLVIYNSANRWEGMQVELSPMRNEPNEK